MYVQASRPKIVALSDCSSKLPVASAIVRWFKAEAHMQYFKSFLPTLISALLFLNTGAAVNASVEVPLEVQLYAAVSEGDNVLAKRLITEGAEVNSDVMGMYPLYQAASKGYTSLLELLVENGAEIDARNGPSERTALHEAILRGHYDAAERLLVIGANPDVITPFGRTPYYYSYFRFGQLGHSLRILLASNGATPVPEPSADEKVQVMGLATGIREMYGSSTTKPDWVETVHGLPTMLQPLERLEIEILMAEYGQGAQYVVDHYPEIEREKATARLNALLDNLHSESQKLTRVLMGIPEDKKAPVRQGAATTEYDKRSILDGAIDAWKAGSHLRQIDRIFEVSPRTRGQQEELNRLHRELYDMRSADFSISSRVAFWVGKAGWPRFTVYAVIALIAVGLLSAIWPIIHCIKKIR